MRHKAWPRELIGLGNLDYIEPIPPEKQPKVCTCYIWEIPTAEWPKGVTAEDVAEMKHRHDKSLSEKRKHRKGEQLMPKRCCINCRWYEYEINVCYNGNSKCYLQLTQEDFCCPEFQADFMTGEEK